MPIDWTDYERVHADRRNLLIHLVAVPLFDVAFVVLLLGVVRGDLAWSGIAVAGMVSSMLLQRTGHGMESEAPIPFSDPLNFLARWFREQFITFPAFVASGRWWRRYADG